MVVTTLVWGVCGPWVGFGVGFAVGFGVGFGVGFAVGFAVGFGVGFGAGGGSGRGAGAGGGFGHRPGNRGQMGKEGQGRTGFGYQLPLCIKTKSNILNKLFRYTLYI